MKPVSPSYIKTRAKKIKKERNILHSKALDEAAVEFGYQNYRHYINESEKKKEGK